MNNKRVLQQATLKKQLLMMDAITVIKMHAVWAFYKKIGHQILALRKLTSLKNRLLQSTQVSATLTVTIHEVMIFFIQYSRNHEKRNEFYSLCLRRK